MNPRRTDANHATIVKALREVGAFVLDLHEVGGGCPDIAVLWGGRVLLVEIKTATGKLKPGQIEFRQLWGEAVVKVVRTVDEALDAIGAIEGGEKE